MVLAGYQDVVWRKVAVHVSAVVDLLQPQQDLVGEIPHFLLAQLLFVDLGLNPDASELHQQDNIIFGLLVSVQLDDVGVVESVEGVDLILNPLVLLLKVWLRNLFLVDGFEGIEALLTLYYLNFAERFVCGHILHRG